MELTVFNASPYRAERIIRVGTDTELDVTYDKLGEHQYLNSVRLVAEPGGYTHVELQNLEALPTKIKFSSSMMFMLSGVFRPFLSIDGNEYDFAPHKLESFPGFTKLEWRCIASVGNRERFINRLWTYVYHDSDVMEVFAHSAYENLNLEDIYHNVELGFEANETLFKSYNATGSTIWSGIISDGQAASLEGVLCAYGVSYSEPDRVHTILQAISGPLLFDSHWKTWGPLNSETSKWGITPPTFGQNQMLDKHLRDWSTHGAYRGYVSLPNPSTTGAQDSFGMVSGVGSVYTDRRQRSLVLQSFYDRQLARQECYRPNKFYEHNGEIVRIEERPHFVPWDERPHWHKGVSPDQLGRDSGQEYSAIPNDDPTNQYSIELDTAPEQFFPEAETRKPTWEGHDREHYMCKMLCDSVIRFDDPIAKHEVEMKAKLWIAGHTLPSQKPGWSTNGRGTGRGQGRTMAAAARMATALGSDTPAARALLQRAWARLRQCLVPYWTSRGKTGSCKPERVIWKDHRVFNGEKPGWIVWEDSIFSRGLFEFIYKYAEVFNFPPEEMQEIQDIAYEVGRSVVMGGFRQEQDGTGYKIAKYIWYQEDSDKNYHILKNNQWYDDKYFVPAYGTDFDLWAYGCVKIMIEEGQYREDKELVSRANDIAKHIEEVYPTYLLIKFGG